MGKRNSRTPERNSDVLITAMGPTTSVRRPATGIVMMLLFGHLRFAMYPRVQRAVQAQRWPDGAAAIASIRRTVVINLVLGVLTIAFGVLGRG